MHLEIAQCEREAVVDGDNITSCSLWQARDDLCNQAIYARGIFEIVQYVVTRGLFLCSRTDCRRPRRPIRLSLFQLFLSEFRKTKPHFRNLKDLRLCD